MAALQENLGEIVASWSPLYASELIIHDDSFEPLYFRLVTIRRWKTPNYAHRRLTRLSSQVTVPHCSNHAQAPNQNSIYVSSQVVKIKATSSCRSFLIFLRLDALPWRSYTDQGSASCKRNDENELYSQGVHICC